MRPDQARPIIERLIERIVVTDDGCWEWQGSRTADGYGRMFVGSRTEDNRRSARTHRLMWEQMIGPIPEGLVIDHLCRNPPCCNPGHLEPVTTRENTVARGIGGVADQARKTHCLRGHPFDEANTYRDRHGKRYCRTCLDATSKQAAAKKAVEKAKLSVASGG